MKEENKVSYLLNNMQYIYINPKLYSLLMSHEFLNNDSTKRAFLPTPSLLEVQPRVDIKPTATSILHRKDLFFQLPWAWPGWLKSWKRKLLLSKDYSTAEVILVIIKV